MRMGDWTDGIAESDYRAHGFDPEAPPGGGALAKVLIGPALMWRWRRAAGVETPCDPAILNELLCGECAAFRLAELGGPDEAREGLAIAYAIPRVALVSALQWLAMVDAADVDLDVLAAHFGVGATWIERRYLQVVTSVSGRAPGERTSIAA